MGNEIEAQFLDIDKAAIRVKLAEVGARLVKPEVLMRRIVFNTGPHSFARVRDEGAGKIVMTYKRIQDERTILGTKEVNVEIDNYENGVLFLEGCGLKPKAEQESYRETWVLDEVEICIDTWPWVPTFIEIEGPSEAAVWETAHELGFDKSQAKFGSVDSTYKHYYGVDEDVVNMQTPKILFDMVPPEWVKR